MIYYKIDWTKLKSFKCNMVNIIPNITGLHSICTDRQMHAWNNACTHGQEDKALITKNSETMQKYQVKYE